MRVSAVVVLVLTLGFVAFPAASVAASAAAESHGPEDPRRVRRPTLLRRPPQPACLHRGVHCGDDGGRVGDLEHQPLVRLVDKVDGHGALRVVDVPELAPAVHQHRPRSHGVAQE